jgi:hypothetical protein
MKNFKITGWIEEMQHRLNQNKIAIILVRK